MGIEEALKSRREAILSLADAHGVRKVMVFGSFARGQQRAEDDLDLLVDMAEDRSYLDLVAFRQDLEELLGRKVDVVTRGAVNPYLRETIHAEAVPL